MSNREFAQQKMEAMHERYMKRKSENEDEKAPYNYLILRHLMERGSITPVQAFELYDCTRLGARIFELRRDGVQIQTEKIKTKRGGEVAKYSLE